MLIPVNIFSSVLLHKAHGEKKKLMIKNVYHTLLQPYPPEEDIDLLGKAENAYSTAKHRVEELQDRQEQEEGGEGRRRRPVKVVSNSHTEREGFLLF